MSGRLHGVAIHPGIRCIGRPVGLDREELMPKWLPALYDYWRQMPTDPTVQKVCQSHEALVANIRDFHSKIFKK